MGQTFIDGIGRVGAMSLTYRSPIVEQSSSWEGLNEFERSQLTSLSALTTQAPYVTAKMPAKATAVFDFQFDGRVHQPPAHEHIQVRALNLRRRYAPDGDQTCFG